MTVGPAPWRGSALALSALRIAGLTGLEPVPRCLTGSRSAKLSYRPLRTWRTLDSNNPRTPRTVKKGNPMAQQVTSTLICDSEAKGHGHKTTEHGADETVSFALDGVNMEMDLCAKEAARFRELITPFTEWARLDVEKIARSSQRGGRSRRDVSTRQHSADVRAWAKEQGIPVSERGRIPVDVREKYKASH